MQCDHAQEFVSEYVTGEMDQALAVTLENHLSACAACAGTVEGLRRLWTTLDQLPVVERHRQKVAGPGQLCLFHADNQIVVAADQRVVLKRAAQAAGNDAEFTVGGPHPLFDFGPGRYLFAARSH